MKIRIKGDSLRIRLTRGEVDQLAEAGVVEQATHFPGGARLISRVRSADAAQLTARFQDQIIELLVPAATVREWATSERVSIEGTDSGLELLLEKDFACLHARTSNDDAPDAYPHPAAPR